MITDSIILLCIGRNQRGRAGKTHPRGNPGQPEWGGLPLPVSERTKSPPEIRGAKRGKNLTHCKVERGAKGAKGTLVK